MFATWKRKDKGPPLVDLLDEPLGKCAKASIIRSWADAINAGPRDPISALVYLYGLMPIGFNTRDMSLGKLGEDSIRSLLTVSFNVGLLLLACLFVLTHCFRAADSYHVGVVLSGGSRGSHHEGSRGGEEAAESTKANFEQALKDMEQQLDELKAYWESEAFKRDAFAHVAAHSREAAKVLCSDEVVGKRIIQGFFNSPPPTDCSLRPSPGLCRWGPHRCSANSTPTYKSFWKMTTRPSRGVRQILYLSTGPLPSTSKAKSRHPGGRHRRERLIRANLLSNSFIVGRSVPLVPIV